MLILYSHHKYHILFPYIPRPEKPIYSWFPCSPSVANRSRTGCTSSKLAEWTPYGMVRGAWSCTRDVTQCLEQTRFRGECRGKNKENIQNSRLPSLEPIHLVGPHQPANSIRCGSQNTIVSALA